MGSDRWRAAWSGGFKEGLCRRSEEDKRHFEAIMYNVSLSDLLTVVSVHQRDFKRVERSVEKKKLVCS